ncbi:hypothetical protein SeMB42_g06888 [Synchytrium endobioticum]|uniref:Uncharacterized protein n=1 Tax=Synchytrium endobioticum TaxID=286115 RepID=A0A507CE63_9FUNG|nr:hypothetical protein SeMB42_g06888 [Synchytrium endobioticum]TPX43461.1 hypothetical protein SeLEV6574_g05055 [Synchytrium endobioticum]
MFAPRSRPSSVASRPGSKVFADEAAADVEMIDFSSRTSCSAESPTSIGRNSVETSYSSSSSSSSSFFSSSQPSEDGDSTISQLLLLNTATKSTNPFFCADVPVKPARKLGANPFLSMDASSNIDVNSSTQSDPNYMNKPNAFEHSGAEVVSGRPHSFPAASSKVKASPGRWSLWSR